jgi:tRNA(fMet)-specific endonuclease VapC
MADQIIMVDTSILIEYFRKKDKSKTRLVALSQKFENLCISSITEFEIYTGAKVEQIDFWKTMLANFIVFPFDSDAAVEIKNNLKKLRKTIDTADLFIAAIAVSHDLIFDTFNQKHFENISDIKLLKSI